MNIIFWHFFYTINIVFLKIDIHWKAFISTYYQLSWYFTRDLHEFIGLFIRLNPKLCRLHIFVISADSHHLWIIGYFAIFFYFLRIILDLLIMTIHYHHTRISYYYHKTFYGIFRMGLLVYLFWNSIILWPHYIDFFGYYGILLIIILLTDFLYLATHIFILDNLLTFGGFRIFPLHYHYGILIYYSLAR